MAGTVAIGTLVFDVGTTAAPAAGVTITAASGATGVVYVVTKSSGTWGGNDAVGTITLGNCTGLFNDNENVTWTGGSCTVNHADGAVGADGRVKNGAFVVAATSWTAVTATLTAETNGQAGNCMQVASAGDNPGKALQNVTTVIGKVYKFTGYFKKGTASGGRFYIGTIGDEDAIWATGNLTDASWTAYTHTFTATATTTKLTCKTNDATDTENSLFDEISLYEIREVQGMIGDDYFMFL